MITLAIDASTYAGDVAVLDDARVVADENIAMKGAEEERLMPGVATALERAGMSVRDAERVVCGAGPGSFTSLRIAGSIAKGIAFGVGYPLFAVPSLALIVASVERKPGVYMSALDALRGEFYIALYEVEADGAVKELEPARVIQTDRLELAASAAQATLVGPVHGGFTPRARGVARLGDLLAERGPIDLATWEPVYGRLAEAQVKWEATHGRPLSGA